ncbi:DUF1003 domain-containing protein [Defluviimonas sp. WL0002]|uniref:DUF1003 domain-containing protein n=1 Tax=Albidovulum marisflavi TaxID=2984159 RepID=A0ABT2ZAP6_9RHOB|nr:DUF1003 domain-containing protein [Defluviimonas sp. WL0002]MCV2868120.1 DUF1003 domain-containing protein [Defluviimonas sp. WL0002]
MDTKVRDLAERLLSRGYDDLPEREQRVLRRIAARAAISRNINEAFHERLTFGQRVADRVASFGGSWSFIFLFAAVILCWVSVNAWLLTVPADPYPFVFLNLILSMLAAIQAPVIMMSQNRQAAKDRVAAAHDYEVNLKSELEIMSLHEKLDALRQRELVDHFARIEERIETLLNGRR